MGGKFGVEEAKKIVVSLASVINVGAKLLKGNVLALFDLVPVLSVLKTVNLEQFKKEILELDKPERDGLDVAFVMALKIDDQVALQKIIEGANGVNDAVDVVNEGLLVVESGKAVVVRAKDVFLKFKKILGV